MFFANWVYTLILHQKMSVLAGPPLGSITALPIK